MSTTGVPGGLPSLMYSDVPDKVHRRRVGRTPHKRRSCRDNRPYVIVPWTFPGEITTGKLPPMWPADRDYWIAGVHASVGLDGGGTASGASIEVNLWVWRQGSGDLGKILANDDRLRIEPGENEDSLNEAKDGILEESHLNIKRLKRDDRVYPEIFAIGSGSPGTDLVVSLELVPYPWPEREFTRED